MYKNMKKNCGNQSKKSETCAKTYKEKKITLELDVNKI